MEKKIEQLNLPQGLAGGPPHPTRASAQQVRRVGRAFPISRTALHGTWFDEMTLGASKMDIKEKI